MVLADYLAQSDYKTKLKINQLKGILLKKFKFKPQKCLYRYHGKSQLNISILIVKIFSWLKMFSNLPYFPLTEYKYHFFCQDPGFTEKIK